MSLGFPGEKLKCDRNLHHDLEAPRDAYHRAQETVQPACQRLSRVALSCLRSKHIPRNRENLGLSSAWRSMPPTLPHKTKCERMGALVSNKQRKKMRGLSLRLTEHLPTYWQTGPASCKNVALSENHPFTPMDGAP